VTITITNGAEVAAAIDQTSATRIAKDAALEVDKALGKRQGTSTATVTVT
jgi:hypothetical protein